MTMVATNQSPRVSANLNQALHSYLAANPDAHLLGEDVADPYGGAFKITKGLTDRFGDRVLSTPLSEGGIVGVAGGLALSGIPAIVEIMFADFVCLAFDQIVNFASKSVSMYGRRVPMPLLVRCPTGGGRGYGPTHSQSLHKHFLGVPGLSLYEVSPFHDNETLLPRIMADARPAMLFEDKVLYTRRMFTGGVVDDLFSFDLPTPDVARVYVDDPEHYDCVLIAPGGMAHRALQAARTLLLTEEISCLVLVPSRLYPFDPASLLPLLRRTDVIAVAEDSTAGGTWGSEVAHQLHQHLWGALRRPVVLTHGADSVIPTASHLEQQVIVRDTTIVQDLVEAVRG
ncbi:MULTISPECIES: alpha-ketoacid dehydrogenase subunit beta [unclassified Streptomyces]|uniref:alpha-ketoacid dehydrogenase subunit beta n=1 Tax=unclassified Streptomyces TaxID=2593676 RepID=UPI003249B53A